MKHTNDWNNALRFIGIILGALVCLAAIGLSFYIKFAGDIPYRNFRAFESSYLWIALGYIVIHLLFGTFIFYNKNLTNLLYHTILGQLALIAYMMALSYAGGWVAFPRSVVLIYFFVGSLILFLYKGALYWLYQKIGRQKKVMIVGPEDRALEAVVNFENMNNRRHQVTHVVLDGYFEGIFKYSQQVDIVYLVGTFPEKDRLKIYEYLMRHNKKLFISTSFEHLMMVNPNIMNFQDESLIEVSPFSLPAEEAFIKRFMDILVSLVLILLTAPIMLVAALAIKLDSPGPALYKQERVTLHGQTFNILKFRSMTESAETESGPVLAQSNDSRITRVGKFIRPSRIDELPQLFNVLKGDMSLVGPRPERPYFVKGFAQKNSHYTLRHNVRAGITGYAQVYGKYASDYNAKLNFDLIYIKNYSLAFDLKLLFQTVKILFDKVSSRGVEASTDAKNQWTNFQDIHVIR